MGCAFLTRQEYFRQHGVALELAQVLVEVGVEHKAGAGGIPFVKAQLVQVGFADDHRGVVFVFAGP